MTARGKRILKRCVCAAVCALWLAFVFTNSLRSMAASARQSAFAEELLRRILRRMNFSGDVGRTAELVARKGAHIFEFFVLFMLAALLFGALLRSRKAAVAAAAALSLAAAAADELLQLYSKRGASAADVLIDAVGIALGVLAYLLAAGLRKLRKLRKLRRLRKLQKCKNHADEKADEKADEHTDEKTRGGAC